MKKSYCDKYHIFKFAIVNEQTIHAVGVSNKCEDAKYVLFLDYDTTPLETIRTECEGLQNDYQLSSFYIFESSPNNYHAVCFDKFTKQNLITIMKQTSIDTAYIKVSQNRNNGWALRLTPKNKKDIKHHHTIRSPFSKHEESQAHIKTFSKLYKLDIHHYNSDNLNKLIYCKYPI